MSASHFQSLSRHQDFYSKNIPNVGTQQVHMLASQFLVYSQASKFFKKKQEISSSYLGIMQNLKKDSRKENFKIFQKKSRKYLVHIQASCKINYSLVTLLKKDSRKENYKHQFCRIRHKKLLSAKVVFLPTLTKYLQKSQILSALREEVAEQSEE